MRRVTTCLVSALLVALNPIGPSAARAAVAVVDEATARLSMYAPGTSSGAAFSGASTDGAHVFVTTSATLDGGPTDPYQKVYDAIADRYLSPPRSGHIFYEDSSPDGRYVLFQADGSLLPEDTDNSPDLYWTDGANLKLVRIGGQHPWPASSGKSYYIAADGSSVIAITASDLLPEDTDTALDVYQWTAATGASRLLSSGIPVNTVFGGASPNFERIFMDVTTDYLGLGVQNYLMEATSSGPVRVGSGVFESVSSDLSRVYVTTMEPLVPADLDANWDAYELGPNGYRLLSPASSGFTDLLGVSADGHRWLLQAQDPLTAGDTDSTLDLYLLGDGTPTVLVTGGSLDAIGRGASDDLGVVVFQTRSDLVPSDTDGNDDLYYWTAATGPQLVTTGVDWGSTRLAAMDRAGTRLIVETPLQLTADDTDGAIDIYRWTLTAGPVLLTPGATTAVTYTGSSLDARRVFFKSTAKLLPEDTNSVYDVYVSDLDVTPPVPTISGLGATTGASASFAVGSIGNDVVWFDCRIDAGAWTHCQGTTHLTGLAPGQHTVQVNAWDAAENEPAVPTSVTWQVASDTVAPTVTAPSGVVTSNAGIGSGKVSVHLAWTGADAGSGIARYELAQSLDGGAWLTLSTALTSTYMNRLLVPGHTYRYRVRAVDNAANVSAWATGSTFQLSAVQESSGRIGFVGAWTTTTGSIYFGTAAKRASTLGAKASISFVGRSIGFVSRRGPDQGRAQVYVNGVLVATIDLYSATYQNQRVVWVGNWATAVSRTITIRVLGTSGRPRVFLDAFVTLT